MNKERWCKSDISYEIKQDSFQDVAVSVLLCGCTTWTLKKCFEKKLDGKNLRMLRAVLNKSRKQYPTKQPLYGHLTYHLANHPSKTNKTRKALLEESGKTHKRRSPMNTPMLTNQKAYINPLCVNTGCSLGDLHREMNNRD